MRELMTIVNVHIEGCERENRAPHCNLLKQMAVYLTRMLIIFGVAQASDEGLVGFPINTGTSEDVAEQKHKLHTVSLAMPLYVSLVPIRNLSLFSLQLRLP